MNQHLVVRYHLAGATITNTATIRPLPCLAHLECALKFGAARVQIVLIFMTSKECVVRHIALTNPYPTEPFIPQQNFVVLNIKLFASIFNASRVPIFPCLSRMPVPS